MESLAERVKARQLREALEIWDALNEPGKRIMLEIVRAMVKKQEEDNKVQTEAKA